MVVMTDRSFKVRAGKVIKAVEDIRGCSVLVGRPLWKDFGSVADEIVIKYFPDGASQLRFYNGEFGMRFFEALVPAMRSYFHVGGVGADPVTRKSHPVAKKPVAKKPVVERVAKKNGIVVKSSALDGVVKRVIEKGGVGPVNGNVKTDRVDIVFSFDDTGSMSACRHTIRKLIDDLSSDLLVKFGDKLNVGLMIHGDYCDPGDPCVSLSLGKDWVAIKRFLDVPRDYCGGDAPECYELVLRQAQHFDWRTKAEKILVLIGDDVPHTESYYRNEDNLVWSREADVLGDMGVNIVAVQALGRKYADDFYRSIAVRTSGYHLRLTQLTQIGDLLRAICYKACGELDRFEDDLGKCNSGSSPAFKRNLDVLAGRAIKVERVEGLSEFQMFSIEKDSPIRDYVIGLGMEFRRGCGYYEFMKPETVQDYKKVVVQDRVTEVFYDDAEGREILRLPASGSVRINPKNFDRKYRFFIQSTSLNRVLKAGTTFLYDDRVRDV